MNTSTTEVSEARAVHVRVTKDALVVDLDDGRTVLTPIAWYPRLQHATAQERSNCRLIGNGEGIHWPDLDEDVSVDGLLRGKASGESQRSFKAWMEARARSRANKRIQPARRKHARG
ncbi:MAG TPA: DUF2442 domain-containing protein [Anaerolineales bacterium]|nr:DUF2442 domain-containing protein [Anaerolineales bacterium]